MVQLRPGDLDLLQLAQNLVPEGMDGEFVASPVRVRSELPVSMLPGAVDQKGVANRSRAALKKTKNKTFFGMIHETTLPW